MTFSQYRVTDRDGVDYNFRSSLNGGVHTPAITDPETQARIGTIDAPAASTNTGLNGLLKSLLASITTLISRLPTTLDNGRILTTAFSGYEEIPSTTVSVGTTNTVCLTYNVAKLARLSIQVENLGTPALQYFEIAVKYVEGTPDIFHPRVLTAADYTTGRGFATRNLHIPCIDASRDLNTTPGNSTQWVELNVERFAVIRVTARAAATTSLRFTGIGNGQNMYF